MAHVYFHCSDAQTVLLDRRGSDLDDLSDIRHHAVQVARHFIDTAAANDWRDWIVYVSDEHGEEIFLLPFTDALGRLH